MNDLAAPFRQLVERRLWPLAVLLLVALLAIPLMLAKDPAPAPVGPSASASAAAQDDTQPVVALNQAGAGESARKVLGTRKNPFQPAIPERRARTPKVAGGSAATAGPSIGGSASGGSSSASGGATTDTPPATDVGGVTPPVTATPEVPKKTYELHSLQVRWGDSSTLPLPKRNLKRLTALPDSSAPALIYMGLLGDKKTAVFLVDGSARVQGDGRCRPTPDNCQTLEMRVGDTAFVDTASDAGSPVQYQIDLVKIRTKKTNDAKAAQRSYAAESASGRRALRARVSRAGDLDYDRSTGTLRRKSRRGWHSSSR